MKEEFSKRKFFFWLAESISFKSELSKMRWPSVLFMVAQAVAHFIVAFVLEVENLATEWVGFQGFILTALLLLNLGVNLWDTKLRFKELLMKSVRISQLIDQCSRDKHLLKQWRQLSWQSARAKTLFAPKSPCIHETLTYRDKSCLKLPDYLLVKGDVIHLFPGERAPSDCVSLSAADSDKSHISLRAGQIFQKVVSSQPENCNPDAERSKVVPSERRKRDIIMQFSHAKLKRANEGVDFLVLSSPYIESLRISLQRSHRRPVNSVEKECFIVSRKYFETFVIPSVFVLSTIVTAIHYGYLDLTDSDQKIKTISIAHLLLRPSLTIMPFLPWMFPCFWLAVNAYGSARLLCISETQRQRSASSYADDVAQSPGASTKGSYGVAFSAGLQPKLENLLATPTAGESSENKHDEDELHDLSDSIDFCSVARTFLDLIWGRSGHIWRSSNLLQVLGCLTSLCCIDKVGILSWSNPTPEKVFTLTGCDDDSKNQMVSASTNTCPVKSSTVLGGESTPIDQQVVVGDGDQPAPDSLLHAAAIGPPLQDDQVSSARTSFLAGKHSASTNHTRAEILDVSQSANCFRGCSMDEASLNRHQCGRLQFDDLNWHKFIDNLKPLGLTILMNNCCEKSFGDYFRFYRHISYESILRCNLTPVVKRRCICALSKLIGFSKEAISNYKYMNQIGIYKLIDPSNIGGGKLVSNLENTARLKLPFSNMICNIHQDVTTGSHQVFSQGTADIILDASVEYWDGKQLVPLDESAKRKIMDFYHRTSLTSYCSAFAYTPLLKSHNLGNFHIELPPENSKFAPHLRKLANEHQEEFLKNQLISLPVRCELVSDDHDLRKTHESCNSDQASDLEPVVGQLESRLVGVEAKRKVLRRHLSMEDLQPSLDVRGEPSNEALGQTLNSKKPVSKQVAKLNETLDELTDQVFVGMVAMQYQACPDFVALVEQLEHACIRFVHFSKENELRSRVFSEKMGLESGWNCHVSLQSDLDLGRVDQTGLSDTQISLLDERGKRTRFAPTPRVANILTGGWFSNRNNDLEDCGSVSSDDRSLYSWRSLPSLVMQIIAKMSPESKPQNSASTPDHQHSAKLHKQSQLLSEAAAGENVAPESDFDEADATNLADYESSEGSSTKDEGFETLAFDMSNRAKLPKGIENIRPHLETVDNVPLQVSLFTDCTPELTKEMIEIMQDYGEIVCVIGSSSSTLNTSIFLQANASIAIEPLAPQTCTRSDDKLQRLMERKMRRGYRRRRRNSSRKRTKEEKNESGTEHVAIDMRPIRLNNPRDRLGIGPAQSEPIRPSIVMGSNKQLRQAGSSTSSSSSASASSSSSSSSSCRSSPEVSDSDASDEAGALDSLALELPSPSALASKLASLPCSYNYNRKEPVNLYGLIMEARHFTFKMKNTFVCMICFALSISSAQFLASLLFLPPMLSSGLTIWLTVVVVPLMSFSLMSTTMDSQVMKIAVGKNLQLKPENIMFFVICYLIKFIPSIITVVLSFGLIIAHSCKLTGFGSSSLGPCWMFTYVQHGNATSTDQSDQDLLWSSHLLTAQVCAAFLLVLYFGK